MLQPFQTTKEIKRGACAMDKVDIVIVLDESSSVGPANCRILRRAISSLLKWFDIDSADVRIGLLTYSMRARVHWFLNTHNTTVAISSAIKKLRCRFGSTNTADALKVLRTEMFTTLNGDRDDATNIGILFTDGISTINSRRTIPEATLCKKQGIVIFSIGIRLQQDTMELEAIARSKDLSISIPKFMDLYDWIDFYSENRADYSFGKFICQIF